MSVGIKGRGRKEKMNKERMSQACSRRQGGHLTCRWDFVTEGAHFMASLRISPQRAAKSFTMLYGGSRGN